MFRVSSEAFDDPAHSVKCEMLPTLEKIPFWRLLSVKRMQNSNHSEDVHPKVVPGSFENVELLWNFFTDSNVRYAQEKTFIEVGIEGKER